MIASDGKVKIIDVTGAVPATKKLEILDREVFVRYFMGHLIERYPYRFISAESDKKMAFNLRTKDRIFSDLNESLTDYEAKMTGLGRSLDEKNAELRSIYSSRAWKLVMFIKKFQHLWPRK
jgi:hypothetical protein